MNVPFFSGLHGARPAMARLLRRDNDGLVDPLWVSPD